MNRVMANEIYYLNTPVPKPEEVIIDCSKLLAREAIGEQTEEQRLAPIVAYLYQCMKNAPLVSKLAIPKWVRSHERLRGAVTKIGLEVVWE